MSVKDHAITLGIIFGISTTTFLFIWGCIVTDGLVFAIAMILFFLSILYSIVYSGVKEHREEKARKARRNARVYGN